MTTSSHACAPAWKYDNRCHVCGHRFDPNGRQTRSYVMRGQVWRVITEPVARHLARRAGRQK